jgi:hypothetical protein
MVGDEHDHFDLGPNSGGGGSSGTMFGTGNGPIFIGGGGSHRMASTNGVHTVHRGDTLWGICDSYFSNPYQWPKIWSYNPEIQNPHWIYPGNQVRLRPGAVATAAIPGPAAPTSPGWNLIDKRGRVAPDTIFLRDQGFIDDDPNLDWGLISGAREDKMIMSDWDEVYLRIGGDRDVRLGQELTIFRPLRHVKGGKLVEIQGTVRIDQWNAQQHIARGRIIETLDAIERGARVGPVGRKFEVVAPSRNEVDLRANVIATLHPHSFVGQNQVIFIDKGEQDGLHPGNRLFVVRRGDAWHQSLTASDGVATARIAIETGKAGEVERLPRPDDRRFPEEVVGELRIIAVRPHNATAIVTSSSREIEMNDQLVARRGY